MERSLKGSVVIIQFPFSDLTGSKKRPALIVADWGSNDVILAQITSVAHKDNYAIDLSDKDFLNGSLKKDSYIRPNKLFTADKSTFLQNIGSLNTDTMEKITDAICRLFKSEISK
jgi:mRNA interferase MazF